MTFENFDNYKKITDRITNSIRASKVSHAYIIEGDRCIDKIGFARSFAKAILCKENVGIGCDECLNCKKIEHDNYEDLYFVKADNLSVKDASIFELQEKLKNIPIGGERNIAVIEDADTMTMRAQNRLLKTLEEPSEGTVIILLSENTENLLQTIRSRCITYRFGNFADEKDNDKLDTAKKIIEMVIKEEYFYDIKELLDRVIKDKKDAFTFIDAVERQYRTFFLNDSPGLIKKEKIIENVRYVEEARRDLLANVNYRYAIRNLILKIGG